MVCITLRPSSSFNSSCLCPHLHVTGTPPGFDRSGYESHLFGRPDLCSLLLSKVPAHKILMNKRVTEILDKDPVQQLARVQCKDGTSYEAHLVVGAGKETRSVCVRACVRACVFLLGSTKKMCLFLDEKVSHGSTGHLYILQP